MKSMYRNSPSEYEVDIAYLAIDDKIFVNKTFENEDGLIDNYASYDNEIWIQVKKENTPRLTMLLKYYDNDDYENSLLNDFVDMYNNGFEEEVFSNIIDMFIDALHVAGFSNTYIGELVNNVMEDENITIYYRFVDFSMHLPTKDNIHPSYDT
jgi:hypothetical protein